jgi:hypothetical protein
MSKVSPVICKDPSLPQAPKLAKNHKRFFPLRSSRVASEPSMAPKADMSAAPACSPSDLQKIHNRLRIPAYLVDLPRRMIPDEAFQPSTLPLPKEWMQELQEAYPELRTFKVSQDHRHLLVHRSGLVVSLVMDPSQKILYAIFGGTGSGIRLRSFRTLWRHWLTNIKVLRGKIPQSYHVAQALMVEVNHLAQRHGYCLQGLGYSKGGGEMAYAALTIPAEDPPFRAICFASAELNHRALQNIPHAELRQHPEAYIEHIQVRGDPVVVVSQTGCLSHMVRQPMRHVGEVYVFDPPKAYARQRIKLHKATPSHVLQAQMYTRKELEKLEAVEVIEPIGCC